MNRTEIETKLLDAVEKVTGTRPRDVTPETELRGGLGLDSFAALELVFELEESLALRIPQDRAATWKTVADVIAFAEAPPAEKVAG